MDIIKLITVSNNAHAMLVGAIKEFVCANGEEMCQYYYDEFGMCEEDDGDKIIKVIDISDPGCFFAVQERVNDDDIRTYVEDKEYEDATFCGFHHHAFWSLYIVQDSEGNESLKYYQFDNQGICYEDSSDPDHGYVCNLNLAQLYYIIEALQIWDSTGTEEK